MVQAWQEASIGAEVNGLKLTEVLVNVGDAVKRGQLLAQLSDETVRTELAAQRAMLNEAKAAFAQAADEARRVQALDGSGAISQQDVTRYATQARTAAARLASARARFDNETIRLRRTRVVAPDNGVISARSATMGAVVSIGSELFRLIRQNRLEWHAEVSGDLLPQVQTGQPVRVRRLDGSSVDGRVRRIAPTVNAATRNGLLFVDLPAATDAPSELKPGMYVSGYVLLGDASAMTLPETAIVPRDGYDYAMVIGSRNRVRQIKLTVGRRQDGRVEIVKGIGPDDDVVAVGAVFLTDGDLVRVSTSGTAGPATETPVPVEQAH
ncbi:efflux RND transporter periplasmic adaptor subunit [Burkholderia guangdongensis]|uniref:efflux RND transporter periplasmic adaptor subunit n=1 Tax=Burkholderia guangdongensis TaxID=1792500 RepID=UPI001FE5B5FE|nr:efflux RND transporter periplasmic adaptor subunit [Burkholderia guangdongensis]